MSRGLNTPGANLSEDLAALRQIGGFYPTPASVVEMMMVRLQPLLRGQRALEPSAGRGDIADRLQLETGRVTVVEPNPVLAGHLAAKGYTPVVQRFEDFVPAEAFDRIAMNPPFALGLDTQHVQRAFAMLAPGGVLVALINDGEQAGDSTREQRAAFAMWLCSEPLIEALSTDRLDPAMLLSRENFRPSTVPVKLLAIRKAERSGVVVHGL